MGYATVNCRLYPLALEALSVNCDYGRVGMLYSVGITTLAEGNS